MASEENKKPSPTIQKSLSVDNLLNMGKTQQEGNYENVAKDYKETSTSNSSYKGGRGY